MPIDRLTESSVADTTVVAVAQGLTVFTGGC